MKIKMKNKIFSLILLLAGIGFVSCESFLSQEPENVYDLEMIKHPTYAQGVLFHAYSRMTTGYQYEDVATDNAVANDMTNNSNNYANFRRAATGEWSPFFDPTNVWSSSYIAINNVNFFLTFNDEVEWSVQFEERKEIFRKRYNAEARALLGYHYLRLLERYGGVASDNSLLGVPVTPGFITSDENVNYPRPPFKVTIDEIYSDLDFAISELPYIFENTDNTHFNHVYNPANNRGRINGQIAWALKVKAALLDASPAYNGGVYDMSKAAFAAQVSGELLKKNGGIAALAPDHIFWDANNDNNNPDIMWRGNTASNRTIEQDNYPPTLYGSGRINPTQNLVDAFPMKNGYPITSPESGYNPANPYEGRDNRLRQNIFVNGDVLRNVVIITASDGTESNALNRLPQYSTRTGYYLRKLLREDVNLNPSSQTSANHFYTYIRWTEMYLAYAEAANEAYGPDADPNSYGFTPREIIAAIRNRAGIDQPDEYLASLSGKEAMRELIRNERRLEFCFEGYRFWDIRRWSLPLNEPARGVQITGEESNRTYRVIDVEARAFQPYMIYCPIPNSEVIKYPELLQNKDW